MKNWQLQEAKARLSEVLRQAEQAGPQVQHCLEETPDEEVCARLGAKRLQNLHGAVA